jgi:hypothetical protein
MSLIHYAGPFLELGICKEYCMARTTGNSTTPRSKKTAAPIQPAAVQVAPEVDKEVARNGKSGKVVPGNVVPSNLEEEIRRRAYELYLQRRTTAGNENSNGDENQNWQKQDWLMAENEIRSRYGTLARHTTA